VKQKKTCIRLQPAHTEEKQAESDLHVIETNDKAMNVLKGGGRNEKESKIMEHIIGIGNDRIHAGRLRRRRGKKE